MIGTTIKSVYVTKKEEIMKKLVAVICMMIVLGTPICAGPSRKLDLYKIEESTWMYLNG